MTTLALLQARAHASGELDPESHAILKGISSWSNSDAEYLMIAKLVQHMLHPDLSARATVAQALQSQLLL